MKSLQAGPSAGAPRRAGAGAVVGPERSRSLACKRFAFRRWRLNTLLHSGGVDALLQHRPPGRSAPRIVAGQKINASAAA